MGIGKRGVIRVAAVLVFAAAVAGGNVLADAFPGNAHSTTAYVPPPSLWASVFNSVSASTASSPSGRRSSPVSAAPSPTSQATPRPRFSSSPALPAALSLPAPSPTISSPAPTPAPTPDPRRPSLTTGFALGWYPAQSATFDAAAINALPVKPQVVNYYSGWVEPFNTSLAEGAYADGIETFVEMEPWNCGDHCQGTSVPAMTDIAAGAYDSYLTSFGQAIETFGHPVLATFAHEMNGNWYPWGDGGSEHTTPAQWIAAWDHVVTVINAQAPGLVTWVWAPNVEQVAAPIAQYWPGAQYVGVVGLDGYFANDSDTYQSVFGQTVADVRALTSLPIWISETGVNQDATTATRVAALAAAAEASGLTGMLYFDKGSTTLTTAEEQALAAVMDRPT
jgi:mannan endo-1,4-beta-mannosidase